MAQQFNLVAQMNVQRINVNPQAISNLQRLLGRTTASINVGVNTRRAQAEIDRLRQQLRGLQQQAQQAGAAAGGPLASGYGRATRSTEQYLSNAAKMRRAHAITFRDIGTLTGSFLTLHTAINKARAGFSEFLKLQDGATIRLAQLSGESIGGKQTTGFIKDARKYAREYGVSSREIASAGVDLVQSGQGIADVRQQLELLAKLNLNKQIKDTELLGESMVVLRSAFGQDNKELEQSLSSAVGLSKQFAVSSEDIFKAYKIAGGVFAQMGADVDTLNAAFTTIRANSRQSAEISANSLKTIHTRIFTGDTSKRLQEQLGLSFFDEQRTARNAADVYREIGEAIKSLPDAKRFEVLKTIGGVRQVGSTASLFGNIDQFVDVYQKSQQAVNTIERDAEIAAEGMTSRIQSAREAWYQLFEQLDDKDSALSKLVSGFIQLTTVAADAASTILPLLAAMGSAKLGAAGFAGLTTSNMARAGFARTTLSGQIGKRGLMGGVAAYGRAAGGAALQNAGAFASANRMPIGLIGASITSGIANNMKPEGTAGAIGKSTLQGATVGLTGFALGLSATTAGFVGLGVAIANLADNINSAEIEANKRKQEQTATRLGGQVEKEGFGSVRVQRELKQTVDQLTSQRKEAFRESGFLSGWGNTAKNMITLDWGNITKDELQTNRISGFQDSVKVYGEVIDKAVKEFVSSGADMSEWATWNNGLMENMSRLYDATDDGVQNQSNSLEKVVQAQVSERDMRQTQLDKLSGVMNQEDETRKKWLEELRSRVESMNKLFDQINKSAEAKAAVRSGAIELTRTKAEFAGRSLSTGDAQNESVRKFAANIGGYSDVGRLEQRLSNLLNVQAGRLGGTDEGKTGQLLTPAINSTVAALRALANTSERTAGYFEDLNRAQAAYNAKLSYAESFIGADEEGRQQLADDKKAAQKLLATGGDFNKLKIEEQQAALRHLNATGNIKGATVGSQFTGEQLKKAALEKTFGSGTFAPEKAQIDAAQKKIIQVMTDAQKAREVLVKYEEALKAKFFSELSANQKAFLTSLGKYMGIEKPLPDGPAIKPFEFKGDLLANSPLAPKVEQPKPIAIEQPKPVGVEVPELPVLGVDAPIDIQGGIEALPELQRQLAERRDLAGKPPAPSGQGMFAVEPGRVGKSKDEARGPLSVDVPTPALPPLDLGPAIDSLPALQQQLAQRQAQAQPMVDRRQPQQGPLVQPMPTTAPQQTSEPNLQALAQRALKGGTSSVDAIVSRGALKPATDGRFQNRPVLVGVCDLTPIVAC